MPGQGRFLGGHKKVHTKFKTEQNQIQSYAHRKMPYFVAVPHGKFLIKDASLTSDDRLIHRRTPLWAIDFCPLPILS